MKRLFTLALLLALSFPMLAKHVDQQMAAKVAETMLQHEDLTPVTLEAFHNLYVFNGDHSFVVVAAEDCARPVLAYSKEFSFKTMQMPENIQGWMASLNDEIQDAVDRGLVATAETSREWELLTQGILPEPKHRSEVGPLIKTYWDQYEPYCNLCPGGSLTGCVATAMAQVMKYWEWPRKGAGSHSYNHTTYGVQSANFGATVYDWDNMVAIMDEFSPIAQQTAVSTLMYHCGVSVDMDYSPDGSAAFSSDVPTALTTYFDFDATDIRWEPASDHDAAGWVACLKNEHDHGRPVYYSGKGEEGGHAFICDGYDTNDYLHFNWGWGGYCNGYFAYGALDPGIGGAGSGSGSYNSLNYAILGAHPSAFALAAPTGLSASVSEREVALHWTAVSGASRYKIYDNGFVVNTNVSGTSCTISDVIYGNHVYFIKAVNADGNCSPRSEEVSVAVIYSGPVATDLKAMVSGSNVQLSWAAPASESAQLKYGDGMPGPGCYGNSEGTGFCWGQRYTPKELSSCAGMAITSVEFYSPVATEYILYINKETEDEIIGLAAYIFSTSNAGWSRLTLPTPIPLDFENELLVAFYNDCTEYTHMAAYTEGYSSNGNACLVEDEGYWYAIDNTISWLIRLNVTDDVYTYSVYRNNQKIASNLTQTSYNDRNLPEGSYQYTVRTQYYGSLSDASNVAQAVIGSSSDENIDSRLAVYPNPTNDRVVVRGDQMESIEVVSLTGQQLASIEVNNDQAEVDLTEFRPGMYVLVIHTCDGAKKVIRIAKR